MRDLELERALKELARKRVKHTRAAIINKREKLKITGVPISLFLNQQHLAKEKMVHLRPEPTAAYELYRPEGTHGLDLFGFLRQYEGESYARKLQLNIKDSVDGMVSKIEETLLAKSDELGDLWVKKEYMSPFNVNVYLVSRTEDIDRVVFYIRVEESSSKRHDSSKVSLGTFDFDMYGAPALCIALSDMLQKNVQKASRLKWFYTSGSQQVHDRTFFISDLKPTYDEFYPCIKQGVAKYFDDFFNSTSNIMILLGPPGTGKTSLIRSMLYTRNMTGWFTYDEHVLNSDMFYVDYMTSNAEILVVEDADVLLTDRESKGNKSMAKMLNVSDGLVKVMSKKIIFTANLTNKNKIDQALLRPGRCFDAIVLDELNREQAAAVANKLGVEVPNKKFVTLAEIFNNRKTDGSINNADVDMSVGFGLGGYRSFDDD